MASFPRTILPFEVTSLASPGPLISKAQSGRVNVRGIQQIGRTWTERYLVNVRSVNGRALLATIENFWRNGTFFAISHVDHLTPLGTGGGTPLINASAQLVVDTENFGNWSVTGTVGRTSGQTDPLGGTAAYLLDSNAGASDDIRQVVTFTGDATKAFSVYMRAGTSSKSALFIIDTTAAVTRHLVDANWSGGVPTLATVSGSGTLYSVVDAGGGWYRLEVTAAGIVAANSNRFGIYPDRSGGLGTVYVFGANAWNSLTPSSYVGTSQTTAATGDRLYIDGVTSSVTNWLRAGDILSIAGVNAIREAASDVNSEANNFVRVPVNPPIFTGGQPSDNAVVTITGVTMTAVILDSPDLPNTTAASMDYGTVSVTFSEAL